MAKHRWARYRLESSQLARRGQIYDKYEEQYENHRPEHREENRRRVGDHNEHRHYAAQHYHKEA